MRTPDSLVSLADLSAVGLRLQPAEAVAVARDVTLRAQRGDLPGVPSANVLRFSSDGTIDIEGPVAAGRSVERAARLLEAMLPGFDAPATDVPGALRLVLGRALGTRDLPACSSLDEFAEALAPFSVPDTAAAVRQLWERGTVAICLIEAVASAPGNWPRVTTAPESDLTISDVRRARRATGLTLSELSERCRIPVSLLRELEWGYFVNWPGGPSGRSQLIRYARCAGLDDRVVIQAVWPMLQEAVRTRTAVRPARVIEGDVITEASAVSDSLVRIEPALPAVRSDTGSTRQRGLLAAAGMAALLTVALIPAIWNADRGEERPADVAVAPPAEVTLDRAPAVHQKPATFSDTAPRTTQRPATGRRTVTQLGVPDPASVAPPPAAQPAAVRSDVAFSPALASIGSAMFYHSGVGDNSAILRADADARGDVLRVTSIVDDTADNFHARPSPDGRLVAFDSNREGERAVYVADADGRNVRRVTGDGFAAIPSWSPDGRRLSYVRAEPERPRVWNLWMVSLDTGDFTRLTSYPSGQPWGAAWFPDGTRIAYSHEDRLIVRSIDGTTEQTYPAPRKGQLLRTPAVSPDGRRVIFQVAEDGAWLLDLPDGSMRRILADPTAEEFTWSPDGRRVAYHSRKTGDWSIWQMAAR